MPQSLAQMYLHIVYSTKLRKPYLKEEALREHMHAYLVGICRQLESPALIVGGVADHVHLLLRQSRIITVADLVRTLKRSSSKWIKTQTPQLSDFHWQEGYGAFSVSPSHVPNLKAYIANQTQHHRYESFQDEFRRLCRKYGLDLDERYAWG
ncbi:MAG: IS200/IS605 family transposase [Planctomycetota bacterium]|jgi:REP element-mobilizing transposase RayT